MAGCGEGELAVVGSGEGERAVGASDEGEPVAAGTDEGLLHSLDYPCTARLRLRRLLAYLRGHGYAEVYKAARGIMPVIFHVRDLVKKVKEGQWQEAAFYVSRFAPIHESSYEANLLLIFLMDLMGLNAFADGRIGVATFLHPWFISIYKKPVLDKYPCFATVVADVLLKRKDHARAFLDWQLIRKKAAKVVEKMAYKTPELRDKMDYPRGRNDLYHVVPIGFKRQLKKVSRKQSTDLAQFYLQMKKSLPSSQGADHIHSDSPMLRGEPLMALLGFPFMRAKPACGSSANHLSIQGTSPSSVRASAESKSAMKRTIFQESHRDAARPGNDSKRPRTTGKFGGLDF